MDTALTSAIPGKRYDAGLGVYPEVSIADVRDKALTTRKVIDAGKDPIEERDRERQAASRHRAHFRESGTQDS